MTPTQFQQNFTVPSSYPQASTLALTPSASPIDCGRPQSIKIGIHKNGITGADRVIYEINLDKDTVNCLLDVTLAFVTFMSEVKPEYRNL